LTLHYTDHSVTLYHGDCLDILRELPDNSVDSVVTDPPYGLGFMGKAWDEPGTIAAVRPRSDGGNHAREMRAFQQWCELWAVECLRVLKPGGHLLAFGGTRTYHRLACAVEDAGFEIRDSIAWLYGSGFPKSLDVSKAIDKAAGAEREVTGRTVTPFRVDAAAERGTSLQGSVNGDFSRQTEGGYRYTEHTAPATDAARQWQGWGTALKPAFEPVVVARKPLTGTVAGNVLAWGTGALNVDGCRIEGDVPTTKQGGGGAFARATQSAHGYRPEGAMYRGEAERAAQGGVLSQPHSAGRWPANVILDETQAAALDQQSGEASYNPAGAFGVTKRDGSEIYGGGKGIAKAGLEVFGYGDRGGASRFFYTAKADAGERIRVDGTAHPTVKPLTLMRWLIRLVTPPGGTVLEPFAGSGTTVEACILEGFQCIAVEREADYLPLIVQRVNRQRDPLAYTATAGEDLGLFGLDGELA
jgi:site-specific DNA-methyltransferase (adenine-specific)